MCDNWAATIILNYRVILSESSLIQWINPWPTFDLHFRLLACFVLQLFFLSYVFLLLLPRSLTRVWIVSSSLLKLPHQVFNCIRCVIHNSPEDVLGDGAQQKATATQKALTMLEYDLWINNDILYTEFIFGVGFKKSKMRCTVWVVPALRWTWTHFCLMWACSEIKALFSEVRIKMCILVSWYF